MMLDSVAQYALKGISTFPCSKKIPLTPDGFKSATLDAATIIKWWTEFPDAQIGIPCGPLNHLVVLDADSEAAISWIESKGIPPTCTVVTSPGRLQYWFR